MVEHPVRTLVRTEQENAALSMPATDLGLASEGAYRPMLARTMMPPPYVIESWTALRLPMRRYCHLRRLLVQSRMLSARIRAKISFDVLSSCTNSPMISNRCGYRSGTPAIPGYLTLYLRSSNRAKRPWLCFSAFPSSSGWHLQANAHSRAFATRDEWTNQRSRIGWHIKLRLLGPLKKLGLSCHVGRLLGRNNVASKQFALSADFIE
jgi:hypothetical protein